MNWTYDGSQSSSSCREQNNVTVAMICISTHVMKGRKMRLIAILFSVFFVHGVMAEPKQLICESTAASEAARWTAEAEDSWNQQYMKRYIEEYREKARMCEEFGEYGFRNVYTFDTRGLTNPQFSKAEKLRVSCGGFNPDKEVIEIMLSATPSIISFKDGDSSFNIDRKTLKAGYGTERDYKCKLQDIDTSDNII